MALTGKRFAQDAGGFSDAPVGRFEALATDIERVGERSVRLFAFMRTNPRQIKPSARSGWPPGSRASWIATARRAVASAS